MIIFPRGYNMFVIVYNIVKVRHILTHQLIFSGDNIYLPLPEIYIGDQIVK